jgi:hypothetical protein
MPRRRAPLVVLASCAAVLAACSGAQQGYYDPCADPAGLVLGCDAPDIDEFTSWDACMKLAACGVINTQDEPGDDPDAPTTFELCLDEVENSEASLGDTVLTCIAETRCPDLAQIDPEQTQMDDPNPAAASIEGVIGYCGRLDP